MIEKNIKILDSIKTNPIILNRLEKTYLTSFPNKKKVIYNRLRLGNHIDRESIRKHIFYAKILPYQYFHIGGIAFKMIQCPRGRFMMGADTELDNPKKPIVIERPFLLGEIEVTQELFQVVMGYNSSNFQGDNYPNSNQRPVENVTWYDAVKFCNKLSEKLRKKPYYNVSNEQYDDNNQKTNIYEAIVTTNPQANGFRLPEEKEWEYVAKAGANNQWAGTNDEGKVKEIAWFEENSENQTHPVKGRLPNEWGFYDMSGNVWEWTDNSDLYKSNSVCRFFRGGSWAADTFSLRSAGRYEGSPGFRIEDLGFRVSASLVN
jgi:formylglycine-generating enzyme required for sulfatase activity